MLNRKTASVLILALCAFACADSGTPTTQPATADQRQATALSDPMSYGGNTDKVDMTGGGISHYDPKAMKRDVDSVLNP